MTTTVESAIAGRYTGNVRIDDIQNAVEHTLINNHFVRDCSGLYVMALK